MNQPRQMHYGPAIGNVATANTPADTAPKRHAVEELTQAISTSHDVLCAAKTVFPFTLFPDTITVDRAKVAVTRRNFFLVGEAITIRIEDILNVTAQVGPLLGNLKITTKFFNPDKPYIINKLPRKDALRIKRILQGYIIARQNAVDMSQFSNDELSKKLDELGRVSRQDRL